MLRDKTTVNRGDIWAVNLDPTQGTEMGKRRPCLVVTNDTANRYSGKVTVVPLTTTPPKKLYPFLVEVPKTANMPQKSWIDCSHIRTIDKAKRLGKYYTSLDSATMKEVDKALLVQLGIGMKEHRSMAG